ncbi:MAG: hypothetical protein ABSA69_05700 [Verrucomicrobiota bacterium]|jgi:preprotein translocase subunit SecD
MIIALNRFNIYLLSAAACVLVSGCHLGGHKKDKHLATLRVHVEVVPESMDFSTTVSVSRTAPLQVTVDKSPILTEANVASARVVDVPGGFDLQIQFDRQGTWLLESYTTSNLRKHLALFSMFVDDSGKKQSRWLAAPIITRRVGNGLLSFTPDATREEAEAIAKGLRSVAKKNEENSKW